MNSRLFPILLAAASAAAASPTCDVRQSGARGDGRAKDTAAIRKAIDGCFAQGGGTVYFPPGKYLTGALELKTNVTLHVPAGAVLLGSPDPEDYPLVPDPWDESKQERAGFIYSQGAENIAITGRGVIDGQGEAWWRRQKLSKPKKGWPTPQTPADFAEVEKLKFGRPRLVKLVRSRNVLIEGVTLRNSPMWTVNPVFCENVNIRGLTILNPEDGPNTDGINPEACRNVHISDCHIDVGDDCVTLKSGTDELGRRAGRACENITITNCTMIHGHGGVVIGSEMSGGVRNVAVSNCVFRNTQRGIRLKSQRGRGGVVEGLVVSNIVMEDVGEPFTFNLYYQGTGTDEPVPPVSVGTPVFRDVLIQNVFARGAKTAGQILGLPEMPFSGVSFRGVRIAAATGFKAQWARDLVFDDMRIDVDKGPALAIADVERLEIGGLRTAKPLAGTAVAELRDVRHAIIEAAWPMRETEVFFRIAGARTRAVALRGNAIEAVRQPVVVAPDVPAGAVSR